MILTEYGLHFAKEADHWRRVEHPALLMLRSPDGYRAGQQSFATLDAAILYRSMP